MAVELLTLSDASPFGAPGVAQADVGTLVPLGYLAAGFVATALWSLGWASGVWVVTRRAAGEPVSLLFSSS